MQMSGNDFLLASEAVVFAASLFVVLYVWYVIMVHTFRVLTYAVYVCSRTCRAISYASTVLIKLACIAVLASLVWVLMVPESVRTQTFEHVWRAYDDSAYAVELAFNASGVYAEWRKSVYASNWRERLSSSLFVVTNAATPESE